MFDRPCQLPHAAVVALAVAVIRVADRLALPELYTTEGARVTLLGAFGFRRSSKT
jgi:hypothetical protein